MSVADVSHETSPVQMLIFKNSHFQSSLLNAILRELPVKSGNLSVNGVVSYASQEPWLFSGSIRQNILFGTDFNLHRYQKVIDKTRFMFDQRNYFTNNFPFLGG